MNILMTTWDGAGNTPPVLSVARALLERGHRVRVMADPSLQADVDAVGAELRTWDRAPARQCRGPEGDFVRDWEGDPLQGFGQLRDRLAVGAAGVFAEEVSAEIERDRPDVLVTEMFLFGALVAGEAAGLPTVVLNPTICVAPRPGVPPFGPGLLPATTDAEAAMHAEIAAGGAAAWNAALPQLNEARGRMGLAPLAHVLEQYASAAKVLILTSEAFDLPGEAPPNVVYVGPRLDDPVWATHWTPPAGEGPLVLVSFSSDFQDQVAVLERTVNAMAGLDARAVVTTGWGVDPDDIEAPESVQVMRAAPHHLVLAEADLMVTHAGHGSTLKALAAGVPLVCLPQGRDQLDVAARVVHAGAGVRLDPTASSAEIAAAVERALADDELRASARRLAAAIAAEIADDRAVTEIEAVRTRAARSVAAGR